MGCKMSELMLEVGASPRSRLSLAVGQAFSWSASSFRASGPHQRSDSTSDSRSFIREWILSLQVRNNSVPFFVVQKPLVHFLDSLVISFAPPFLVSFLSSFATFLLSDVSLPYFGEVFVQVEVEFYVS